MQNVPLSCACAPRNFILPMLAGLAVAKSLRRRRTRTGKAACSGYANSRTGGVVAGAGEAGAHESPAAQPRRGRLCVRALRAASPRLRGTRRAQAVREADGPELATSAE